MALPPHFDGRAGSRCGNLFSICGQNILRATCVKKQPARIQPRLGFNGRAPTTFVVISGGKLLHDATPGPREQGELKKQDSPLLYGQHEITLLRLDNKMKRKNPYRRWRKLEAEKQKQAVCVAGFHSARRSLLFF